MPRNTLALAVAVALSDHATAADPPKPPLFNADVRPIFKAYCFECHGEGEKLKANLDLRLRRLLLKGGNPARRSWKGSLRRACCS